MMDIDRKQVIICKPGDRFIVRIRKAHSRPGECAMSRIMLASAETSDDNEAESARFVAIGYVIYDGKLVQTLNFKPETKKETKELSAFICRNALRPIDRTAIGLISQMLESAPDKGGFSNIEYRFIFKEQGQSREPSNQKTDEISTNEFLKLKTTENGRP